MRLSEGAGDLFVGRSHEGMTAFDVGWFSSTALQNVVSFGLAIKVVSLRGNHENGEDFVAKLHTSLRDSALLRVSAEWLIVTNAIRCNYLAAQHDVRAVVQFVQHTPLMPALWQMCSFRPGDGDSWPTNRQD